MRRKLYYLAILVLLSEATIEARSIHRPHDPSLPVVSVSYCNDTKKFSLADSHWEYYPTFCIFNQNELKKKVIPQGGICLKNNRQKIIPRDTLAKDIEELLSEVYAHKKQFQKFKTLQRKDFSRRKCCGLLILKHNNYPLVIKLFMETPQSFVQPWGKGREPIFLFYMGGGVNRHLAGLTRLKNLDLINKKISNLPQWKDRIITPRKWFWLPKNPRWMNIHGKNINGKKNVSTKIPGVYVIIADYIENDGSLNLSNLEHRKTALTLCNDLGMTIDPHIQNFFIEKKTKKIAIVDTEHFPTMVGFKEKKRFNNYLEWYLRLSGKCAKNLFFRTKDERKAAQFTLSEYRLP